MSPQANFPEAMHTSSQWMWPSPANVIISRCLPACRGYLPHVEFRIDEFVVGYLDQKLLATACKLGAPAQILEFIMARTIPNWKEVVKSATEGGHLHVFDWMVGRQDGKGSWWSDRQWCLTNAATYGHIELVKWLHSRGESTYFYNMAFRQAARNGHLQVVQWMHEHTDVDSEEGAMDDAAENGHLEVVQWLYEKIKGCGVLALMGAARNGHVRTLQWLHQRASCSEVCTSGIMDIAVGGGHFDVVEWLFEHCSKGCSKSAAWGATRNGDFDMLMWLNTRFHDQMNSDAIHKAASRGNLDFVKWFHENPSPGSYRLGVMDAAAQNGHLEVVQWLHDNRGERCGIRAMDSAVENGHLGIVRWMHEHGSNTCSESAMCEAAANGHLNVVKWLIDNKIGKYDGTLIAAAQAGRLDVVVYLDENTEQRGSDWGLGAAARQGPLQVLLVLALHELQGDRLSNSSDYYEIRKCVKQAVDKLADQCADPDSIAQREVSNALEQFHAGGYYSLVCIMLDRALQGGYLALAGRRFIRRRNEEDLTGESLSSRIWPHSKLTLPSAKTWHPVEVSKCHAATWAYSCTTPRCPF